ncbi:hypothetical protein [Clostridium sp. OS1-26]|uniref:hypothetical protein n=1 Tax=Clostridium sp. OS1-26 TaxID=3070681 RepID=UPI0027DFB487|nr:hypothetical protein [Clostridium sp. OS1-26]WML33293.1 hypothetical protein RCG18_18325 [Clostridium sp. OS1-26]
MKNMMKLNYIEFFLRCIPEALLIIWGICIVARKSINIKIYIFSSTIMGLVVFFVRMLPIYFGVHTFIGVVLIICTMAIIGMPIVKSIYGTLLMFLILSLSEYLNMTILNLLNVNTNIEFTNPVMKSVFGIPSLIITGLFIIVIQHFTNKGKKLKNVID